MPIVCEQDIHHGQYVHYNRYSLSVCFYLKVKINKTFHQSHLYQLFKLTMFMQNNREQMMAPNSINSIKTIYVTKELKFLM